MIGPSRPDWAARAGWLRARSKLVRSVGRRQPSRTLKKCFLDNSGDDEGAEEGEVEDEDMEEEKKGEEGQDETEDEEQEAAAARPFSRDLAKRMLTDPAAMAAIFFRFFSNAAAATAAAAGGGSEGLKKKIMNGHKKMQRKIDAEDAGDAKESGEGPVQEGGKEGHAAKDAPPAVEAQVQHNRNPEFASAAQQIFYGLLPSAMHGAHM
ncbi:hypothetical protein CYMTET_24550 [Cymbomonas tetramitiformis]|uniref:Uncharacterized protein n=1 Tax=Cymbomonas tetramitiformis TaxID=36881 RepID=A0AAE0FW43_9CHLO|nr:hypothetical protein CYMTET_24550 [Cymbomonas tetramitiformis]